MTHLGKTFTRLDFLSRALVSASAVYSRGRTRTTLRHFNRSRNFLWKIQTQAKSVRKTKNCTDCVALKNSNIFTAVVSTSRYPQLPLLQMAAAAQALAVLRAGGTGCAWEPRASPRRQCPFCVSLLSSLFKCGAFPSHINFLIRTGKVWGLQRLKHQCTNGRPHSTKILSKLVNLDCRAIQDGTNTRQRGQLDAFKLQQYTYLLSHEYSQQTVFGLALIFANSPPTFLCEPT